MRQPYSALVYPVRFINHSWEYLLLRRIAKPDLGLTTFWQGVTGALKEGENIMQTAIRELSEETHFIPDKMVKIDFTYSFPIRNEWRNSYGSGPQDIVEHVFLAFVDGQHKPILSEHHEWCWCDYDRSLKLLQYPESIKALQECQNYMLFQKDHYG